MFYFYLVLFVLFLLCCCYVLSRAKYSIARDNLCVCFFWHDFIFVRSKQQINGVPFCQHAYFG